jgi:hypothetical protein
MIAWRYLDKKSAVVDALKDYSSMEYIIQNNPDRETELKESMKSVSAVAYTGLPKANNPKAGEARLAATLDEIDVLKERYRNALEYMDWFQPAWEILSDDEQFILEEFFMQEDTNKTNAVGNICDRFGIERSWAYKKKDSVLTKLSLLLYGK